MVINVRLFFSPICTCMRALKNNQTRQMWFSSPKKLTQGTCDEYSAHCYLPWTPWLIGSHLAKRENKILRFVTAPASCGGPPTPSKIKELHACSTPQIPYPEKAHVGVNPGRRLYDVNVAQCMLLKCYAPNLHRLLNTLFFASFLLLPPY